MIILKFSLAGGTKDVEYKFNPLGKQCKENPSFKPNKDWITVTTGTSKISITVPAATESRDGWVMVKIGDTDDTCIDGGTSGPHKQIHIIQSDD